MLMNILRTLPPFRQIVGLQRQVADLRQQILRLEQQIADVSQFSHAMVPVEQRRYALEHWYRKRTGLLLDLENPRRITEKLQWLKMNDSTPQKTRLADKYAVREWVAEKLGDAYLVPLLGVWDRFDDIDFSTLPERFVLKATHGSGWNILVSDKANLDKASAKNRFDRWMSTDYSEVAGFEFHYSKIPPRIIAEEFLEGEDGELVDYKVTCFNGTPEFVGIDSGRYTDHKRDIFDAGWNPLPFAWGYAHSGNPMKKPLRLAELLEAARTLSSGFLFARVDFYITPGGIKFGEITFTPGSGVAPITPDEYYLVLGEKLRLPGKAAP